MNGSKTSKFISKIVINLIFILVSLCCVVPLLYILSASFTSEVGLALNGYTLIPGEFSTSAYEYIFKSPKQLINSYIVTVSVTVFGTFFSLLFTSMLGYVLARKDFKFNASLSFLTLFTLLFNGGMVPTYILLNNYYHLGDSIFALILPYIIMPWHVFLMKGFFGDTPMSLIEAAKIDGANEVGIFFRIVAPISKPAFAAVGLFIAFTYWNDWWLSLMYINDPELNSLQYYLYRIMNNIQFLVTSIQAGNVSMDVSNLPNESARMALCVLAAGPMLIIFPFFQKYFVRGLSVGAVKG